jgi:protocatechuate 3,4-dioxygenase beta subunit
MQSRSLALTAALLGIGGLLAWLLWPASGLGEVTAKSERTALPKPVAPRSDPSVRPESGLVAAPTSTEPAGASEDDVLLADPDVESEAERRELSSTSLEGLEDALWVEGKVVFPSGTPADEQVEIVARGRKFAHRDFHRARVAPDGSFRVAFAPETITGRLRLKARYLYLPKSEKVRPRTSRGQVVLEPKLGTRVEVRLAFPTEIAPTQELVAELDSKFVGTGTSTAERLGRDGDATEALTLTFDALEAFKDGSVSIESKAFTAFSASELASDPGRTLFLDAALRHAARIKGRVTDEAGQPLEDARVAAFYEGDDTNQRWWNTRVGDQTEENGAFDLGGLRTGNLTLDVSHKSHLQRSLELGDIVEGEVRESVTITLAEGGVLEGQVRFPDGKPAAGAKIGLDEAGNEFYRFQRMQNGGDDQLATDAEGRFRITGLVGLVYVVSAHADVAPGEPPLAKGAEPRWHARLPDARPGATGLVLVLESGHSIAGHVVDAEGKPVERFRVFGTLTQGGPLAFFGAETGTSVGQRYDSKDGSFVLDGLRAGTWRVSANGTGFVPTSVGEVLVPEGGLDLRIVLQRPASVRGLVLDPAGNPIARAAVDADYERAASARAARARELGVEVDAQLGASEVKTGKDGTFKLKRVPPGKVTLKASFERFLDSADHEIQVAPGQIVENVVLRLQMGGRIEGELHAAVGDLANRYVSANGEDDETVQTDEHGRFVFECLEPGTYQVELQHHRRGLEGLGYAGGEDPSATVPLSIREEVEVLAGTTVRVLVGRPLSTRIHLSGTVTELGKPADSVLVKAILVDKRGALPASGRTEETGRYDIDLADPGQYRFELVDAAGETYADHASIPDEPQTTRDFSLPIGRIAGRVLSPDGKPLASREVQLSRALGEVDDFESQASETTDSSGAFSFERLRPNTYRVSCGGVQDYWRYMWRRSESDQPLGPAFSDELEITASTRLEGIELRLTRAGTVLVTVVDDRDQPLPGVSIQAKDDRGHWLQRYGWPTTDKNGYVVLPGMPPGRIALRAKRTMEFQGGPFRSRATQVSSDEPESEEIWVSLTEGETTETRILLRP